MGIFNFLSNFRKSNLISLFLRTLQLIDGLVVIGLYGVDLNKANKEDKYSDQKWVYAVTVGSIAAISAVLYSLASIFLPYRTVALLFAWDWMVAILFAAQSGIFGTMYLNEKTEMEGGIYRMKVAAGFDLAGLVLWFITAVIGTWWILTEKRNTAPVPEDRKT
ncbi:uncharacterized protein Z518_00541 [Rhinocladiella mackenziei CBS 650.93]|uniref:MARVEL domain-containing protein n=1 Tax=Rhinocladiella mackenziei CBS 650.93 TaxID=1442369 RepID=A0A0D2J1A3_9EURO|nr:uncharacterized protein Z518_00541 [Rhinocladiella mackenziei CBS 650.93]KIX09461.1 hypothetical protein Z518_00541 [Rhinocladiella mackenziei CBS 650.93]